MCLGGRTEIFLYPEVDFQTARPEPAAAAGRQRRRLFQLGHAEDVAIELTGEVLASGRNSQLDMVQPVKTEIGRMCLPGRAVRARHGCIRQLLSTTRLVSVPMPSMVTDTPSPATTGPMPSGVPVSSTSPGSIVITAVTYVTSVVMS